VDQEDQLLSAGAELLESRCVGNGSNRQNLSEVITSAERAESRVELG
jgi:hypothetical protein